MEAPYRIKVHWEWSVIVDHWEITIGLGVLGFLLTWTGMVVAVTKAVTSIKTDTAEKIAQETTKITDRLNRLSEQFEEDQRTQDNRYGEVAMSIRQYVSNVEKEMHQIEIWGRDNFVLKSDFVKAVDRLEKAMTNMAADIKTDLRTIFDRMEEKRN